MERARRDATRDARHEREDAGARRVQRCRGKVTARRRRAGKRSALQGAGASGRSAAGVAAQFGDQAALVRMDGFGVNDIAYSFLMFVTVTPRSCTHTAYTSY